MGKVTLRWTDRSSREVGQRIYRSEAPIDTTNLPPVLVDLPPDVEEYIDETVEENKTYHYVISSYNDTTERFSEPFIVSTEPGIGPGSTELVLGDDVMGFFGEVPANELITNSDLTTLVQGPTAMPGTVMNADTPWLKFILDGKILYYPKLTLRNRVSWDQLNALDLVYGNRIIEINGYQFKIRLLKGADTDPCVNAIGYYVEGTHNSEWSRLFYPLVRDDTKVPTRDPNAPYTNLDLGMTGSGSYVWCQETHPEITNGRVTRGGSGVSYLQRGNSSTDTNGNLSWRPCLELVL